MSNLHIDSVTKSFGGTNLLTDIFLNCEIGQIKGLVGKNGSGKTTLLKIIFGTVPATNKFVKVGDKLIKNLASGRGLINYLPQDNFLPNNIKVEVLIRLFLDKENASILMANEFVIPLLNKKNEQLSGGEKRIIEILLIVHSKAKFILLDEPFNGVSPKVRDYIVRYIQSNKSTKGFLITDHDFESIFHLSDKILYLENGFLREIDNLQELVEHGYLTKTIFDNLK